MSIFGSLYGKLREATDIDLEREGEGAGDVPPSDYGFDEEMIQEFGLVPPKKKRQEYDEEQMDMGISVESEHTTNPQLAAIIAANHLDEIPDYYTRLKEMEEEAKGGDLDLEAEEGPSLEDEEEKAKPMQNMEGVKEKKLSEKLSLATKKKVEKGVILDWDWKETPGDVIEGLRENLGKFKLDVIDASEEYGGERYVCWIGPARTFITAKDVIQYFDESFEYDDVEDDEEI